MAQKGGPCYRGQARLSTTSQALRASSPKGGASGVPVRPTRDKQSLILSETVVPCYRGQQLRNNILVKLL